MNPTPAPSPRPAGSSDGSGPAPSRLVARRPEDLVAFAPLAIGFHPDHSAVLLTVGGSSPFHARVDLPEDPDDVDLVVEALLRPALHHRARAVVFLLYDDDTTVADEAAWSLRGAFVDAGVEVVDVLRVHEGRWFAVLPGRPAAAYDGVPFDVSTHPFAVQAVVEGRVTRASRDELRATLDPRPRAVELTAALLRDADPVPPGRLRPLVESHLAAGTMFDPAELASVAATISSGSRRDEVWTWQSRSHARPAVELWSDAVRRLPSSHVAAPAAVLAFAAWLAGDGALAWCAVDLSRRVQADHSLADLVAELLESATSPESWPLLQPALGTRSGREEDLADPAA